MLAKKNNGFQAIPNRLTHISPFNRLKFSFVI